MPETGRPFSFVGAVRPASVGSRNKVVEADHGKLKRLIKPTLGFKSMKTAYATIKGFEVMRTLKKQQARSFNFTEDIHGETRIIERAFGLGNCVMNDMMSVLQDRLKAA